MACAASVAALVAALAAGTLPASTAVAELAVTADPSFAAGQQTFDLRAVHTFHDTGYALVDQSISVTGCQIDLDVLIQDLHAMPGSLFQQVLTPTGALFDDYGPLAAGTYWVNAQMWLTDWPGTGREYLYDMGSLTFLVPGGIPEPRSVVLMLTGAAILWCAVLRRKLGQVAA